MRIGKRVYQKSGYVIYVATSNNAEVTVLLADGSSKLLIFEKRR